MSNRRQPHYSLAELAARFGVRVGQLRSAMRRSPVPVPERSDVIKPPFRYPLAPMLAWWDEVGGVEFAVSERTSYNDAYRERCRAASAQQAGV